MQEIDKIVVPVDFDQHTNKLVDFAVSMAQKLSARILFLHVSEGFEGIARFEHPSIEEIDKSLRQHAENEMSTLLARVRERCPACTGKVINGYVVDGIIEVTRTEQGKMIIIGTHGAKGINKILLGSVAERVVKDAPCPVLTFNPYK